MKKALNVLYQSNDNYAAVTGVSVTSLLYNNKNLDEINIYILNDNISNENLAKFKKICDSYKRNLILLETDEILKRLKELKVAPFKGTYTTYFKLMALKSIKLNNGVVLQLDGDTVINGSLAELCDMNLDNAICAATFDCTLNKYKRLIDIPASDKYYNCGVLLINQKMWKKEKCEEQIVNHLKNVRNGYYTVDQDIINVLFRKKIKYLDLKYNFNSGFYIYGIKESLKMYDLKPPYYNSIEEIKEAYKNPIIYHCMGAMTGRPWEQDSIHPQNKIFDEYLAKSPWKGITKKVVTRKKIFKVQRFLYKSLPRFLYMPIHSFMQNLYLKNMNKIVTSKNE
jgi:lipopolysaccharide biosynthesis glycosyltransferase